MQYAGFRALEKELRTNYARYRSWQQAPPSSRVREDAPFQLQLPTWPAPGFLGNQSSKCFKQVIKVRFPVYDEETEDCGHLLSASINVLGQYDSCRKVVACASLSGEDFRPCAKPSAVDSTVSSARFQ